MSVNQRWFTVNVSAKHLERTSLRQYWNYGGVGEEHTPRESWVFPKSNWISSWRAFKTISVQLIKYQQNIRIRFSCNCKCVYATLSLSVQLIFFNVINERNTISLDICAVFLCIAAQELLHAPFCVSVHNNGVRLALLKAQKYPFCLSVHTEPLYFDQVELIFMPVTEKNRVNKISLWGFFVYYCLNFSDSYRLLMIHDWWPFLFLSYKAVNSNKLQTVCLAREVYKILTMPTDFFVFLTTPEF